MPMAQVENVGVWYFGCTTPNDFGSALYAAMASVVRAVGRIVVCADAAADDSTASTRNFAPHEPSAALPMPDSTSSVLSGLVRPRPVSPTPAYACAETVTRT